MRSVWKYYFTTTEAVIFVVDASAPERLPDVKEELWRVIQTYQVPVLLYLNKQDLPNALNTADVVEKLETHDHTQFNKKALLHIQECCCKGDRQGEGLQEGFKWLTEKIVELDLAKPVRGEGSLVNNV